MIKQNKFLQEEEENEKIIKKFVDDTSNIRNWKNEELERIEKIINPSLVVNKKLRSLPIFGGSYFNWVFLVLLMIKKIILFQQMNLIKSISKILILQMVVF